MRVQERKAAARAIASERPSGIVQAIVARSINDLAKELVTPSNGAASDGTLDHLLTETSTIFSTEHPRIYGKGDFQIEVRDTTGIKVVKGTSGTTLTTAQAAQVSNDGKLFVAPESDPKVWIESAPTECSYRLTVKVDVCRVMVEGRLKFKNTVTDAGLNIPFVPGCPPKEIATTVYRTYLNVSSPIFATTAATKCGVVEDPNKETDFTFLVEHSQSDVVPTCPIGFKTLWDGYSLMGFHQDTKKVMSQDLGSIGSCVEEGSNVPFIRCSDNNCDYIEGPHLSGWLASQAATGSDFSIPTTDDEGKQNAVNTISRCTVCEGKVPLMVKHSYSRTPPTCPPGWNLQWQGYSFGSGGFKYQQSSQEDLGNTGSCLKTFNPNPVITCEDEKCEYSKNGVDFNVWLLAKESASDGASRNNDTDFLTNQARISRCAVCSKDF